MSYVIIKNNWKVLSHLLQPKQTRLHLGIHICYLRKQAQFYGFDDICQPNQSQNLITFATWAKNFTTVTVWSDLLSKQLCSNLGFAHLPVTSKILCLIKFAYPRKFVQSLGLLTFASWANMFNTKSLVTFAMQSNLVQLWKFDHPW